MLRSNFDRYQYRRDIDYTEAVFRGGYTCFPRGL